MLNLLAWLKIPIGDAAFYSVLGFVFVFFGIVLLILIFTLLGFIMKKINARQKKDKRTNKKTNPDREALNEMVADFSTGEITPELVAVITAAINACMEEENAQCEFVVRRIKKL